MDWNTVRVVSLGAVFAAAMVAQPRQATMVRGASPDRGKCTVEVVVDAVAQVEVRGTSANLKTLQGQPAQWRRFECTGPMPAAPANFRFAGVDGRGHQQLVRDPRQGGVAVVQIEDPEGGAEAYTFDLLWETGNPTYSEQQQRGTEYNPPPQSGERDRYRNEPNDRPEYRDGGYYRQYGHPFTTDEAVRACQQQVFDQASRKFRTRDIHFSRTGIDDNPGRNDWVIGTVDVHNDRREERFHFSCSVDFRDGRVRSAEIDPRPLDGPR